jgi:hypothetical protein
MGTLEDLRKMFQDFLAPELRAIDQKLKNMEQGHIEDSQRAVQRPDPQ